jgi:hypothetical protein
LKNNVVVVVVVGHETQAFMVIALGGMVFFQRYKLRAGISVIWISLLCNLFTPIQVLKVHFSVKVVLDLFWREPLPIALKICVVKLQKNLQILQKWSFSGKVVFTRGLLLRFGSTKQSRVYVE